MGCNRAAVFLMMAFLSAAATPSEARLSVSGQLCCTATGNCPGQGLGGQVVRLKCTDDFTDVTSTVGESTTEADGRFTIIADSTPRFYFGIGNDIPCVAIVDRPVNRALCPALSSTTTNKILTSHVIIESAGQKVDSPWTIYCTAIGFGVKRPYID